MTKKNRNIFIVTLLVAVTIYFLASDYLGPIGDNAAGELEEQREVGTNIGDLAPDFTLEDMGGDFVSLDDYRGKVVMINFWSLG